jgi:hypothetical protein
MDVKAKAKDAMLAAIEQERDGEQIDRSLLKNVLGIYIEVGMGGMECYNEDFEQHLLSETAAYYKKKAAVWIAVCIPSISDHDAITQHLVISHLHHSRPADAGVLQPHQAMSACSFSLNLFDIDLWHHDHLCAMLGPL